MKETTTVNLGGQVFHIDTDACETLGAYLKSIEDHLMQHDSKDEIMQDIEARIAELFRQQFSYSHMEVVNIQMVQSVMQQLGTPEMIGDSDSADSTEEKASGDAGTSEDSADADAADAEEVEAEEVGPEEGKKSTFVQGAPGTRKKKLYRDIDHKQLAGVCSGLEARTDVDAIWFRIIFILLTLVNGCGLLVYLVAMIVMPAADTAARRLEMRGEEPSAENIQHQVEEQIKNGVPAQSSNSGCLTAFIIGMLLILAAPLLFLLMIAFAAVKETAGVAIGGLLTHSVLLCICLGLIIIIPLVVLIIWAVRRREHKEVGGKTLLIAFILWILLLIGGIVEGIRVAKEAWNSDWTNIVADSDKDVKEAQMAEWAEAQFELKFNDQTVKPAVFTNSTDGQGRPLYCAALVDLKAGDKLTVYNGATGVTFCPKSLLSEGEYANFTLTGDCLVCMKDGTYDIYIATEENNDEWSVRADSGAPAAADTTVADIDTTATTAI